jgi:hypothetical protein
MDWNCDQVVEHLLCKHEALSSNSSLTKKKKKSFDSCHPQLSYCFRILVLHPIQAHPGAE